VIAVLTGGYLWTQFHGGGFGTMEKILAVGIFCAFAAAGAQGAIVGSAARKFSTSEIDENVARSRITVAQRIAAGLLAVTIVCMAVARYV